MKDIRNMEEALHGLLSIEDQMYHCQDRCTSCDTHSPMLELATRQAVRAVHTDSGGVPHHMERLSNHDLAKVLARWADARDQAAGQRSTRNWQFQEEHSEALRVTAERLRVLAVGCVHPGESLWRGSFAHGYRDICQRCGAIVNHWVKDAPPDHDDATCITCQEGKEASVRAAYGGGSRTDKPLYVKAVERAMGLPADVHLEDTSCERPEHHERGWMTNEPCVVPAVHGPHDYTLDRHCPGWAPRKLADGNVGVRPVEQIHKLPMMKCNLLEVHDEHSHFVPRFGSAYCPGTGIDDSQGGDTRGLTEELTSDIRTKEEARRSVRVPQAPPDETIRGYDDPDSGGPMYKYAGEGHQSRTPMGTSGWHAAHNDIDNNETHSHPLPYSDWEECTHSHYISDRAGRSRFRRA